MAATKKIKKVEIPIDQRETFVSLQKSFADSEISVEQKLKTLYQLQEADNAIDKIVQLRGELPAEVKALEDELTALNDKIAGIWTSSRPIPRQSRKTSRQLKTAMQKSQSTSASWRT